MIVSKNRHFPLHYMYLFIFCFFIYVKPDSIVQIPFENDCSVSIDINMLVQQTTTLKWKLYIASVLSDFFDGKS